MEETVIFYQQPDPKWLSELIENDSVIEDWEPLDQWEDVCGEHFLYCWQPNGKFIKVYPYDKIGLAQYKSPDGSTIKYAELIKDED